MLQFNHMYRTHTCNELTAKDADREVTLAGWVASRRDHGGLIFVDLRDRYGVTQIVADPGDSKDSYKQLDAARPEYVIKVIGTVRLRPKGSENPKLATGAIEVLCKKVEILNSAKTPPFEINSDTEINEELRLKYRYLDLRRARMKRNMEMRHKMIKFIRDFLSERDFLEIETPILIKGTPEGSREYVVPSRLHPGKFFVLPQSPQQLKQLCMVAGLDRYFQIARCFRDEDQRGDRQPEFTQLDLEMSFVNEEDIMSVNEDLMTQLCKALAPEKKILASPFSRMSWEDALNRFGSDKPDLRFEMELADASEIFKGSNFKVFTDALEKGGVIKMLRVSGGASFSRSNISELETVAKNYGAKGLAYITQKSGELASPILKFLNEKEIASFRRASGITDGDIVFFTADEFTTACISLGHVRLTIADYLKLRDPSVFAFCWVLNFPMFEWSKEFNCVQAAHHPFCSIKDEDIQFLDKEPMKARAKAYDFVLNGSEIAGGSIRIHKQALQSKIFKILGISKEDQAKRFGHMLEAFTYGAPPHGGIAWGLDRLIMIFCNEPNIREVIAFPKDQRARDLMLGAPSELPEEQIKEMHIKAIPPII